MNTEYIFNLKAFLFILGGLSSLLLTVMIKIANRKKRIIDTKSAIEEAIQMEPSLRSKYGDINQYLENDPTTQSLNFWDELVINSMQPLLLLSIISQFDNNSTIGVSYLLALVIISFGHEIVFGEENAKRLGYRLLILIMWVAMYFIVIANYKGLDSRQSSNIINRESKK